MTCFSNYSRSTLAECKSSLIWTTIIAAGVATGFWASALIDVFKNDIIDGRLVVLNVIMMCCSYIIHILNNYKFTSTIQICKLVFPATSYLMAAILYMIRSLSFYYDENTICFYVHVAVSFVWFSLFFAHLTLSMKILRSHPDLPPTPECSDSEDSDSEDEDEIEKEPIDMA